MNHLTIAESPLNRALFWVFLGAVAIALVGCASPHHANTSKQGYHQAKADCENAKQMSNGTGAVVGAGGAMVAGRLLTGSTNAMDAILGAGVGYLITNHDNAVKVGECLKARGY